MKRNIFQIKKTVDTILYEWPLEYDTPPLAMSAKILEKYNLKRTKKQVQDRWITL